MKPDEFVKLAIVTEAPVGPAKDRIAEEDVDEMILLIGNMVDAGKEADDIKRYIFYGASPKIGTRKLVNRAGDAHIASCFMDPMIIRLLHAGIGMFTEAAEFLEAILNHIVEGEQLDMVNLMEEVGDNQWYAALAADAGGFSLGEAMTKIIAKLQARYPDKFTEHDAAVRDINKERDILEE